MAITIRRRVLPLALIAVGLGACESQPMSPTPTDSIVGRYALSLTAGSECASIPARARNRTYSAKIERYASEGYLVTLSDATFVTDVQLSERSFRTPCGALSSVLGCNQFLLSRDGPEIEFQLIPNSQRFDNEFGGAGGTIVEQTAPDTVLMIHGTGRGRLEGGTIEATLQGGLWSCSPVRGDGYCAASVTCDTNNLRLVFTRK